MFEPPDAELDPTTTDDLAALGPTDTELEDLVDPMPPLVPTQSLGAKHALPDHTAQDGLDELVLRVIQQTIDDMQRTNKGPKSWRWAQQAALDVEKGHLEYWLLQLPVSECARDRVRKLLLAEASKVRWQV